MAQKFINMTGERYGRLICIAPLGSTSTGMIWECHCDCGTVKNVVRGNLLSGSVQSCGCLREEKNKGNQYGLRNGRNVSINGKRINRIGTYSSWEAMISRCYNSNHESYQWYGARGISVCKEWRDNFLNFLFDMGERPLGKTLDRINTNGNYEKNNCKWSTPLEQTLNRRPRS